MATSTGKKTYSITINGLSQSISDVTALEKALNALDKTTVVQIDTTNKVATATKAQTKTVTDQDAAAKKLADTLAKTAAADSAANKAQIAATQALRDKTKEVTRAVAQDSLEADSIAAMGMQLTDLRNTYAKLSAEQRNNAEVGGAMLDQIQSLDSEYKALKESTGQFQDSVGDYKKGIQGLDDLQRGLTKVGSSSTALASQVVGTNAVLDTFGETTDVVEKSTEGLYGILATAQLAQYAYNQVVKEGAIQSAASAVVDGVRSVQAKAAAASIALEEEATVGATVAQAAFNVVAAANPYVLLALALVAVTAALFAFISSTDKSVEHQKQANDEMQITLDLLDQYAAKSKVTSDAQTAQAQAALDLANAQADGSVTGIKRIQDAEDQLQKTRVINSAKNQGFYATEIANLDANRAKVDQLQAVYRQLELLQSQGDTKAKIDIDLDGKIDNVKIEDALGSVQKQIDQYNKQIDIAVGVTVDQKEVAAAGATLLAQRAEQNRLLFNEQQAANLDSLRKEQDDTVKATNDTYQLRRQLIKQANDREIQDLQIRLNTDKTLTATTRANIEKNIVELAQVTTKQLHDEDLVRQAAELDTARQEIDSRNAIIEGADARAEADINTRYDRETHDLQNKLKNDTTLTVTQQAYINTIITNLAKERENELNVLTAAGLQKRSDLTENELDATLATSRDLITKFTGETTVRSKTGLQLIDVDATKANLANTNTALQTFIDGEKKAYADLVTAHDATIGTLKEGTAEYQEAQDKFAADSETVAGKIVKAEKEQAANTIASQQVRVQSWRDAASKISAFVQEGAAIFQQATDILTSSVQAQIDSLNTSLDAVNTKYTAAQAVQQAAVQSVQSTEQQLQDATGGTADALKSQLADQMRARNEAARQEQDLAKQQQKLQDDIAKKQKQAQRITLLSNIAQATASGSQAVVMALAAYPPPFSYIAAAITGALAAVQVGIMAKQLTKLATGGPIVGNSHSAGGETLGDQYEVEGGEFVVNKGSYANNAPLVRFINESTGAVSASDLVGLVSGGSPMVVADAARSSNQDVIDAIDGIDIRPVVAVKDINDVNDQLTAVQELAGF